MTALVALPCIFALRPDMLLNCQMDTVHECGSIELQFHADASADWLAMGMQEELNPLKPSIAPKAGIAAA